MYTDGVKAVLGLELPYRLIGVEPRPPFPVQTYAVTPPQIEHGRQVYRSWLDRLALCRAEGIWPGYADGCLELDLPKWFLPPDDEDF